MNGKPAGNRKIIIGFIVIACFVLSGIVAWLAPSEQTLGQAVKLIYIHASLVFVSLILVSSVGILGLLFLITGKQWFLEWARPAKVTTILFWALYLISSVIAMQWTWGGIVWEEPRMALAFSIFLVLVAIYLVSITVHAPKLISLFNVLMGVSVWVLIANVPEVLHPTSNPITASPSIGIRLSTLSIFMLQAIAAVLSVVFIKQFSKKT